MIRRFSRASWPVAALLLGGSLLLAACTTGSVTGTGTGTPAATTTTTATTVAASGSAADILNHAKAAQVKDAKFTIAVTAGSPTSTVVTANGTGTLTNTPARTDITISALALPVVGTVGPAELISDQSTGIYVKAPPTNQWIKFDPSILGATIGTVDFLHYDQLQAPTLIGTETIDGFTTYHVKGLLQSLVGAGGTNSTVAFVEDLWLRQSDYYPIKVQDQNAASVAGTPTATSTTSATATATTITDNRKVVEVVTFNDWNTGATISLPTGVIGG